MTIFLRNLSDGRLLLQARAEGEGMIGDLTRELGPGDEFLGHTFEELQALGQGRREVEPAPGWRADS